MILTRPEAGLAAQALQECVELEVCEEDQAPDEAQCFLGPEAAALLARLRAALLAGETVEVAGE
jgi:hypothetical protein